MMSESALPPEIPQRLIGLLETINLSLAFAGATPPELRTLLPAIIMVVEQMIQQGWDASIAKHQGDVEALAQLHAVRACDCAACQRYYRLVKFVEGMNAGANEPTVAAHGDMDFEKFMTELMKEDK